ncbi:MAG: hypothetical protein ACRELZ_02320 [Candidatus Rokuibacteriota bacterium]
MIYTLLALLSIVFVGPAAAQVHIDIGIRLPAPPPLVIVPGVATVQYAPSVPGNVFFYSNQYWIYASGGWHVSRRHDGPWIVVAPQFVPRPVLFVPVRYYHAPPGHWKQWRGDAPPHWGHEWGHGWAEKRAWKDRDKDHGGKHHAARAGGPPGHGRGDGPGKEGHGKGHGRGK